MGQTKTGSNVEVALATLALAKAIIEGDIESAKAALAANANPDAFWLDGLTSLRELPKHRLTVSKAKAMQKLLTPAALKTLPPMSEGNRELWSQSFLTFVAQRGYRFSGSTDPLSRLGGTDFKGLDTAKAGVRLVNNKWPRLEEASCRDLDDGRSHWFLTFGATWKADRRIVGAKMNFVVDALAWDLVELFEAAKAVGKEHQWPELSDPLVASQKDWEGRSLAYEFLYGWDYAMADLIGALRKGVSPFAEIGWSKEAVIGSESKSPEVKAFMEAMREAVGEGAGWHIRITPLLTESGVEAIQAKANMMLSTPNAAASKKSLKNRKEIMAVGRRSDLGGIKK